MTFTTIVPLVLLVALGAVATVTSERAAPRLATWVLTAVGVAAMVSTAAIVAVLTVPLVLETTLVRRVLGWCSAGSAAPAGRALALLALIVLVGWTVRTVRALRTYRSVAPLGPEAVLVIRSAQASAYAVPGASGRGQVVVTSAMLDALGADERRAMFAHERAHLAHGHHRFLRIGDLCARMLPPLRPLSRRIAHATERWADEVAVTAVGSRRLVARSVALAGLASVDAPARPLAIAATGVAERVRALHAAEVPASGVSSLVAMASAAGCWGLVVTQLHHLVTLLQDLC